MKTQIPCCCFGYVYGPLTRISSASHLHLYFRQCAELISLEMVLLAVFALLRPTEGLTPPDGGMAMPIVFYLLHQLTTCRTGHAKVLLEVVPIF